MFHLNTSVEKKGHYLFRVYDDNQDKRIDEKDLTQIFKLIYPEDLFEGHHSRLARKAMDRFEDKIGDKN